MVSGHVLGRHLIQRPLFQYTVSTLYASDMSGGCRHSSRLRFGPECRALYSSIYPSYLRPFPSVRVMSLPFFAVFILWFIRFWHHRFVHCFGPCGHYCQTVASACRPLKHLVPQKMSLPAYPSSPDFPTVPSSSLLPLPESPAVARSVWIPTGADGGNGYQSYCPALGVASLSDKVWSTEDSGSSPLCICTRKP